MSVPAISVTGLGKRYYLSHQRRPDTLRDSLTDGLRGLWRRVSDPAATDGREEFWALRDVSFEVAPGDVIGIIGRNGAGKSTLLKLLSRITEPTTGRAVIHGRVASLLEVGTGFHPELSGRDNIFLNGAILGMSRVEIRRKFDEIVAFADVERFLDTQVKHYSSGMYVRLAFAVAAHLDPDILIVDEVLAVGDAAFQKKCLAKMDTLGRDGKTVVVVSHQLETVIRLCRHALWFGEGQIIEQGPAADVVGRYLGTHSAASWCWTSMDEDNQRIIRSIATSQPGKPGFRGLVDSHLPFSIDITTSLQNAMPHVQVAVRISDSVGRPILSTANTDTDETRAGLPSGTGTHRVTIPGYLLAPGRYRITAAICVPKIKVIEAVEDLVVFEIADLTAEAARLNDGRSGCARPLLPWEIDPTPQP